MNTEDPLTGKPYPPDAIQRVLFIASNVRVYQIPPMSSNKGHSAASWTTGPNGNPIFTARLRILETAIPIPLGTSTSPPQNPNLDEDEEDPSTIRTDILLEDAKTGQLFAAAPYTSTNTVEQVLDSSRFFAVAVRGAGGQKATLGIGFEERAESFDFSTSLQEARKVLSWADGGAKKTAGSRRRKEEERRAVEKKDFSLKEGETITVVIGGKGRRQKDGFGGGGGGGGGGAETVGVGGGAFVLPPPPGSSQSSSSGRGAMPMITPPLSAQDVRAQRRLSRQNMMPEPGSAADLGFDDGEFGEFQ